MSCQCVEVSTQDTESSESNEILTTYETNTKTLSNHYVVNYGEIENYQKLNTLINYKYYILTNNKYYLTFIKDDVSSNHIEENIITNYYFTNKLTTNDVFLYSNYYFQTIGNNFYKYVSNFSYKLISNDTVIGYSNVFTSLISSKNNSVTSFSLTSDNEHPYGITTYNNKFYIVDWWDKKNYIYNNSGGYDSSLNFTSDNGTPFGIIIYNNKIYVTDNSDDQVYIYSSSGVYETKFDLTNDNPRGITTYNNKFYVIDATDKKIYIYTISEVYESNFPLTSGNNNPRGITTYNNKFYVTDDNRKVYIYSDSGAYESTFDVTSDNGNPRGITTYGNKFYIADRLDDKLYIYPFD